MNRLSTSLLVPLAALTILAGALLSGNRPVADEQGRRVVVYAHPPCPPALMRYFDEAFDDFRKSHPDIDLQVLHITGSYQDKIKVMFAGNVAPDVIFMYPSDLAAWVELGALTPLDDLLAANSKTRVSEYFPAAVQTYTYNGHLYALPKDASAELLFYNPELFRKHGLSFPTADWTWQDMLHAAKAITEDTDGDGRPNIFGLQQPEWQAMVRQNGGRIVSADGTRCELDSPQSIEALEFWVALRQKYKVVPTPESSADMTAWRMFVLKRAGMFISMYPVVPVLRRSCDFEWDIALPPRGSSDIRSAFTGSSFAVTSQSRNPDAAFEWARWMTSEGMKHIMTFDIPANVKLGQSQAWRDPAVLPKSKQVAVDVMQVAGPPLQHPEYAQIIDAISPHLDKANRGDCTVAEAVQKIVPKVNEVLARHAQSGGGR